MLEVLSLMNKDLDVKKAELANTKRKISELEKERDAKIISSKRAIMQEYDEKIKESQLIADQAFDERNKTGENIVSMCSFDIKEIGDIISQIITFYEGEPFSYVSFSFDEFIRWNRTSIKNNMHVICSEKALKTLKEEVIGKTFDEENNEVDVIFKKLIEDKSLFILDRTFNEKTTISFVKNDVESTITSSIDYTNFEYVGEFIGELLQLIYSKKIKDISMTKVKEMEIEFLKRNREEIEKGYIQRQSQNQSIINELKRKKMIQSDVLNSFGKFLAK